MVSGISSTILYWANYRVYDIRIPFWGLENYYSETYSNQLKIVSLHAITSLGHFIKIFCHVIHPWSIDIINMSLTRISIFSKFLKIVYKYVYARVRNNFKCFLSLNFVWPLLVGERCSKDFCWFFCDIQKKSTNSIKRVITQSVLVPWFIISKKDWIKIVQTSEVI